MASVSWTATTNGSWNTGGNWSTGSAPLSGDDVTINPSGASVTVTYNSGTLAIDSLVTGASDTLDITGGSLATEANGYDIQGNLIVGGGTLRLVGGGNQGNSINADLTQTGGTLAFVNDAVLQGGALQQSAGTMSIAHGVLQDRDSSGSIGGTVTGAGEFELNGNGTTILAAGAVISTGAFAIAQGTLFLNEKLTYGNRFSLNGTLDLNGNAVTLSGHDALDGDVNSGTLNLTGTGHLNQATLENGAFLNIASTIDQTGDIQLGGSTGTGTLNIAAGGTLLIHGNNNINQGNSVGTILNKGTLEKIGGGVSGQTQIRDAITSTGTIDAAVGTINFVGPNNGAQSSITGAIAGAGTVEFSNGDYTLGGTKTALTLGSHRLIFTGGTSSTNITIASALSYAGNWEQTGGLLLLQNDLTLSGITALDGGELKGTATITDSGPLTLGAGVQLEGNLTFLLNGPVDQTGTVNFGDISDSVDQATLSAGNSWVLEGAANINGAFGTITNQGTFAKENGLQNDNVASQVFNTGTMLVESGTLSLTGQGTLGGTVSGSGVLDISGQFALASGLALSVGELILDQQNTTGQLSLNSNLSFGDSFAQEGGTLSLNGHTLTLGGTTSLDTGAILGSGSVIVTGQAVIDTVALAQGAQLQFNSAATEQTGNVTLTGGSTAPTLTIGSKDTYTMDNGVNIGGANNSVIGTVAVAGTLVASGAGTSTIAAAVQDTGIIQISHGQMQFLGPLSGSGSVLLSAGGGLGLDANAATSTGVTFGTGGGLLTLADPGGYTGTIGGFATGDSVELNGFAFATNGTLATLSVSGSTVTISEPGGGPSATLTFSAAQSTSSLVLGQGPHGGLSLIHV